jgi:hypothetical protein
MQALKIYSDNAQQETLFLKWRFLLGIMRVESVTCFQQHISLENYKEQGSKTLCMERIKAIDFCQKEGTHAFTPIKIFKIC